MKNSEIERMLTVDKFDALDHAKLQGKVGMIEDFLFIPDMLKKFNLKESQQQKS